MDPLLLSSLLLATISFDCAKSKECAFVQEKFGIVYMTSNFWQLAVGSRDLSQAEKKYVIVWAECIKTKWYVCMWGLADFFGSNIKYGHLASF